ncbi:hypothetical protein Mapa_014221 [Marchantia paleacea]|nr:hypothetical protein Mapa_014221 [Marchantia paleacea]
MHIAFNRLLAVLIFQNLQRCRHDPSPPPCLADMREECFGDDRDRGNKDHSIHLALQLFRDTFQTVQYSNGRRFHCGPVITQSCIDAFGGVPFITDLLTFRIQRWFQTLDLFLPWSATPDCRNEAPALQPYPFVFTAVQNLRPGTSSSSPERCSQSPSPLHDRNEIFVQNLSQNCSCSIHVRICFLHMLPPHAAPPSDFHVLEKLIRHYITLAYCILRIPCRSEHIT